jgi:hypothetical protein
LNHFAKDCRDRITKGHANPLADVEEGTSMKVILEKLHKKR